MNNDNEQIMSAMIDSDLYSKIRKYCHDSGTKVKRFVSDALKEKLKNVKSTKKT